MKHFFENIAQKFYFAETEQLRIKASDAGIPTADSGVLFTEVLNLAYYLAGILAVIVIVIAGFMYVISTGDAGRVAKAKNLLTYSIVGLIIVLVAFTITNFVIGRF